MKKLTYIKKVFVVLLFVTFSAVAFPQMLAPEDPGGEPGTGDDPIGGGAPLSGGTLILTILGAAYGGIKLYETTVSKKELNT